MQILRIGEMTAKQVQYWAKQMCSEGYFMQLLQISLSVNSPSDFYCLPWDNGGSTQNVINEGR